MRAEAKKTPTQAWYNQNICGGFAKMTKNDCYYGIYPVRAVWPDNKNNPKLIYKKHSFDYWEIDDLFWECWKCAPDYATANLSTENTMQADFAAWMKKNGKRVKNYMDYLIEFGRCEKIRRVQ